ncbi:hypothetical protein D3C78_945600 [compost metagenome]
MTASMPVRVSNEVLLRGGRGAARLPAAICMANLVAVPTWLRTVRSKTRMVCVDRMASRPSAPSGR